jgi:hypothetical protein
LNAAEAALTLADAEALSIANGALVAPMALFNDGAAPSLPGLFDHVREYIFPTIAVACDASSIVGKVDEKGDKIEIENKDRALSTAVP